MTNDGTGPNIYDFALREHREAIARMDPAQIRAMDVVVGAAMLLTIANTDKERAQMLRAELSASVRSFEPGHPFIPEWWIGQ